MNRHALNRRGFLQQSVGAIVGAGVTSAAARAEQASGERKTIRLGGPVFGQIEDPEELALAHRRLGYRAAYCPGVSLNDTARIDAIAKAFAKHDVVIAEVGRWCNLLDADPAQREANIKNVSEGLALAEAVGARCCVDIAGSFNETSWFGPHPDNFTRKFFDATVENARRVIDGVKPKRAKFCFEMMGWAMPSSPDEYLALIKAVDREAFGVHLDVCNLVNSPLRFYRNADLINECFDKLGSYIASSHAKDLVWDIEMNVHFREVPPGSGSIDYTTWLRRQAALDRDAPLMIEHCANEAEYTKGRTFLLELGPKIGVRFG